MTSGRIWLNVPYSEKEDAKKIGARWNPIVRRWWISPIYLDYVETRKAEWLNSTDFKVRVRGELYLVIAEHICSKCEKPTRVVGLLAEKVFELNPERPHRATNLSSKDPAYLSDIRSIGDVALQGKIDEICPYFWPNRWSIYRNHCENCGNEFHDSDELYAPKGPLVPSEDPSMKIKIHIIKLELDKPISFDAGLRWIWNERHNLFRSLLGQQKSHKSKNALLGLFSSKGGVSKPLSQKALNGIGLKNRLYQVLTFCLTRKRSNIWR